MAGAGPGTLRVTHVNANWEAARDGEPGRFALLVVTEDGERHTVEPATGDVPALLALVQGAAVLLWDPDHRTLISTGLLGEWLPADWSGVGRSAAATADGPG